MIGGLNPNINAEIIYKRIAKSSEKVNRKPNDITIVAVTKSFPVTSMISAFEKGFSVLGESRIQETEKKLPHYPYRDKTELHLIGHLQGNKAKKATTIYDVIQSVDSIKLAHRLNSINEQQKTNQRIFFQINTGNDPNKFGITKDAATDLCIQVSELPNIVLEGLMVIAPLTKEEHILRQTFSETRKIRDELISQGVKKCKNLSMGMSGDFEIAIEEGATHIRLGTALFGERK